ncbi:RNA polymerase sigma factor [Aestuariibaculum suncheonense]|uniref:RNA polymerase sigma-70 factor n=1 Tax=Aestuariibaculum suncheonense TaxID=1028745 RepID=A0A8J6QHY6_9FLAO|nr:RNA polymerase sigma-70 factor [Aestuariibaculum suncheonense]MBD0836037.1 RNA polymerase sigma-70 factor [Aestuariibaculum suncheonense]
MSTSHDHNINLIRQLQNGDEKAFTLLINTYHKPLFIYALNLTKDHAAAEDIVQNTFLKTWKYRKKLNTDFSIKNLLYKSTFNNFISHYRKEKAFQPLEETYIEAINETIDEDNADVISKKIALITQGIEELPKKCKEIFLLSKQDGLTNIEIAEYLNISIKTVEGQITKAYRILRDLIGDQLKEILFILFDVKR